MYHKQAEPVDVVVIGSGFGGAVAALRLGEAGYQTVVLERGRRWPVTEEHNTFATYARPDGRAAWLSPTTVDPVNRDVAIDRYTGILDRKSGDDITVLTGVGLGGGSLVFNGAMIQPLRAAFEHLFPPELDYGVFESVYYPRVRSTMQIGPLPEDLLHNEHFESSRLFLKWVQGAGLPTRLFDMALDWSLVRQEITGEMDPHVISGQEMWYGLNSGARLSLDKNYLAQAEATRRVEILLLHVVTGIEALYEEGEERFLVSGQIIDTAGNVQKDFFFLCKYLFVAAGSIKTSELMVQAQARGTLPHMNQYVGQGWGNNGDAIGIHVGHAATTRAAQVPGGAGAYDLHNPSGPVLILGDALNDGSTDALLSLAMTIPSTNPFPNKGFFRFHPETGEVSLHWPKTDPAIARLLDTARSTYATLDAGRGDSNYFTPMSNADMTMHPLGGMVLGKACHLDGRVAGYEHLYVIDGSLLPGSAGCVNPSLTIAALAEHIMDRFVRAG